MPRVPTVRSTASRDGRPRCTHVPAWPSSGDTGDVRGPPDGGTTPSASRGLTPLRIFRLDGLPVEVLRCDCVGVCESGAAVVETGLVGLGARVVDVARGVSSARPSAHILGNHPDLVRWRGRNRWRRGRSGGWSPEAALPLAGIGREEKGLAARARQRRVGAVGAHGASRPIGDARVSERGAAIPPTWTGRYAAGKLISPRRRALREAARVRKSLARVAQGLAARERRSADEVRVRVECACVCAWSCGGDDGRARRHGDVRSGVACPGR